MDMHYPGSAFPGSQSKSHKPLPGPLYLSLMDKWEKHQAFTYSLFSHMHKQRKKEESSPGTSKQLTMKSSILQCQRFSVQGNQITTTEYRVKGGYLQIDYAAVNQAMPGVIPWKWNSLSHRLLSCHTPAQHPSSTGQLQVSHANFLFWKARELKSIDKG